MLWFVMLNNGPPYLLLDGYRVEIKYLPTLLCSSTNIHLRTNRSYELLQIVRTFFVISMWSQYNILWFGCTNVDLLKCVGGGCFLDVSLLIYHIVHVCMLGDGRHYPMTYKLQISSYVRSIGNIGRATPTVWLCTKDIADDFTSRQ